MNTTMTSGTAANRTSDGITTFRRERITTVSTPVDEEASRTEQAIDRRDQKKTGSQNGIGMKWTVEFTLAMRTIHEALRDLRKIIALHTVSLRIPWQ